MSTSCVNKAIIEARGMGKRFGDNIALENIDLRVHCSEVVCLIGPSDSGKSTLLRYLAFLKRYDKGEIELEGELFGFESSRHGQHPPGATRCWYGLSAILPLAAHDGGGQRHRGAEIKVKELSRTNADTCGRAMLDKVGLADKACPA